MLFAIHALDRASALPTRLANYDAHKAFLSDTSRFGVKIVMSGPLVSDDGASMIGSLFLIEAPGRAEVEAFNRALRSVCGSRHLGESHHHGLPAPPGLKAYGASSR
ncbi:uncharacterized protein YciI [Bradyrhizobium sp. i1.4.4]